MNIIDEGLLGWFRAKLRCEYCGEPSGNGCDPHHLWSRGSSGRIDVRQNIVALCRSCHTMVHDGNISRNELLRIVAEREKTTVGRIERTINRLRLIPKTLRKKVRKV